MEDLYIFVMKKLAESKHNWVSVAKMSNVPISTVRKIAQGHTKNPGIQHIQALANFFKSSGDDCFAKRANAKQSAQDALTDA